MSSPINNTSSTGQSVPAPSGSSSAEPRSRGFTSPANAITKQHQHQQRVQNEVSSNFSHRGRSGRSLRGRGSYRLQTEKTDSRNHDRMPTHEGLDTTSQALDNTTSSNSDQNVTGNRKNNNRKMTSSRGGGKYRQRQQTNQLIEGMEGLDIDLAESLVSTNPNSGAATSNRERHPTNSRKVNLTHLLNLRYDRKQRGGRHRNSSYSDNICTVPGQRTNYSYYRDFNTVHKFSKQQFLQANCQFVVLDGHDYTIHKVDPDWPIEWDCIEEVKFRQIASTETTCPICLDPPIAAKITRCGHIYCWTCMLHYLSLSDENCRQCPICFEPVYKSDLRSVVSQSFSNHAVGEEILMRLMIRKKGCVEVEPYHSELMNEPSESSAGTSSYNIDDMKHYSSRANLVIVDPDIVIQRVAQREKDELLLKFDMDRNEPEVCFIEQALDRLNKRIERLQKMASDPVRRKNMQTQNRVVDKQDTKIQCKSYLFYQSADGQHIYLNPFSTKILCHQYNCLESCPVEIRAKILQMDWVSMSEAWRKRFKYLEHLPLTCEFRLIEIDFEKSELVSKVTVDSYIDQIRLRANERERRRREERKREKIIQVEQNRKIYGIQPSLKINLNNNEQFPSVSDERYLGLTKSRNYGREIDDILYSSDSDAANENNELIGEINMETITTEEPTLIPDNTSSASPEERYQSDIKTGIALSFLEIQQQEAEESARSAKSSSSAGAWGGKKSSVAGSNAQSSSFAQLLVDAKTSQKSWTRNVSNPLPTNHATNVPNQSCPYSSGRYPQLGESDAQYDGEEELRAPPSEFTISDFIDMNVVAGKRGKGKLNKNVNKKG